MVSTRVKPDDEQADVGMNQVQVTYTMQRCAAEIFRLQEHSQYVSLSELAEEVDTSLQALSRLLGRLKEGGFLVHQPYQGVRLTDSGTTIALPALRRHRLAEVFLVRMMGFGWDEVHALTDQFERGIDETIEDRIFDLCGQPARCPHGEPIPSKAGVLPALNDASLVEMPTGAVYRLSRVRIHDPEKLRYLGGLGLVPQRQFTLRSFTPFQGPVRIVLDKQDVILSYEMAAGLWVERP